MDKSPKKFLHENDMKFEKLGVNANTSIVYDRQVLFEWMQTFKTTTFLKKLIAHSQFFHEFVTL